MERHHYRFLYHNLMANCVCFTFTDNGLLEYTSAKQLHIIYDILMPFPYPSLHIFQHLKMSKSEHLSA